MNKRSHLDILLLGTIKTNDISLSAKISRVFVCLVCLASPGVYIGCKHSLIWSCLEEEAKVILLFNTHYWSRALAGEEEGDGFFKPATNHNRKLELHAVFFVSWKSVLSVDVTVVLLFF